MHLSPAEERRLESMLSSLPCKVTLGHSRKTEIYRNEEWDVVRVAVHDPMRFQQVVRRLEHHFPHFVFFDSDIPVPQLFLYAHNLFPLAYGEYEINEHNELVRWALDDTFDASEYKVPSLIEMKLSCVPDFVSPKHRAIHQLEVTYDQRTYNLENDSPASVLASLKYHLERCDPDIISTQYGDAILLPMLVELAARYNIPLALNRDRNAGYFTTRESSYFVYGKITHKEGAFELAGRWHLDSTNSFIMGESNLDGVIEIARMTQLPVQRQSRSTIGTCLSSMQLSWAIRNNYLVPAKKREPEDFKSAATLLLADRGGLIFQPKVGYHEEVAELDFVSMYPTIMVRHNISPETVNCRCCPPAGEPGANQTVPELGYTICKKRAGIVPSTLTTVVEKRSGYKKKKKLLKKLGDPDWERYDHYQSALKWMLVTCFGYLGYKNARFGRIEAHESVNAFSRDIILKAKEIAEAKGFTFIHAIVDCLWLKKPGATEEDYQELAHEISRITNIELSLEGIYNWILFPASKTDPALPTANRYVGYYRDGDIKVRGIELRRRDTPVFVKRMQGEMLNILEPATSIRDVQECIPALLAKAQEFIDVLRSGKVEPMQLAIRRHVSQEADQYRNRSISAEVTKLLGESGITIAAGEAIDYIIVDATGKKKPEKAKPLALYSLEDGYDIEKYTELCLKACETLLAPFGYNVESLREDLIGKDVTKRKRRGANAKTSRIPNLFLWLVPPGIDSF